MKKGLWVALLLSLCHLFACGGISTNPDNQPTGLLYVLDHFNKAVYTYENLSALNGNLAPARTLTGSTNTLIDDPTAIAVDSVRDILYVADNTQKEVLAFIPASQADGDVSPRRTYPGLLQPGQMFFSDLQDSLFVTDLQDQAIFVWDDIRNLSSGTAPSRTINLGYEPSGIFVDGKRDILYVGSPVDDAVNIYLGASTLSSLNTPVTIDQTITDATQPFDNLNSLALNIDNNFLFVMETKNPSIEVFENASLLNGAIPTVRSLEGGSTGMGIDTSFLEFDNNILYLVLSRTNVGMWDNANSVTGDVAPTRNLQVTPAVEIIDLAVDRSH